MHRRRLALLSPYDLFVFVVGRRGRLAAWLLFFGRTRLGLRLRASAFAPEVSRLLGVNVAGMRTVGWALAAAVAGALAAMLVIPTETGAAPQRDGRASSSRRSPRRCSAVWTARRAR